jgi:LysR family transcriptional regulator, hydrogen peroxide-inducible genes activator
MEVSQVRYFLALSQTLNFTRAAEMCNVTQPALSRAIQRLEAELGGALIYRERSLTQLTEFGRTMRPHLQAMLEAAEAAHAVARTHHTEEHAMLRLGLGPAVGLARIAGAIRSMTHCDARLIVQFDEGSNASLGESMLADRLDCALLPDQSDLPDRLHRWPLYDENCVVVLPADHRLVAQKAIAKDDLFGETLLLGDRCGGFAERLMLTCGEKLAGRRIGGSWPQMLDLVAAKVGLALLPEGLTAGPALTFRPLSGLDFRRTIVLALVAGRPRSHTVLNFVKVCRAMSFS